MKILIDTNVVLDFLCRRQDFFNDAQTIIRLCETDKLTGLISALTIPNIVYIMRKELTCEKVESFLEYMFLLFSVVDLKTSDLTNAAKLNFKDYEDAVQSVCAQRVKADYIITRNTKDFIKSKVKAVTPSEFLNFMIQI